ncbi:hypothetical protein KP509_37G068600 [Ceratopteris richardii]|uniref:DUF819 domain-containing protein n=1 Tax=Ceratopteris richardii TaxID=49495 RepID=A0A8T2Q9W5_CERRI|nr:hypothetical protein KP509_37G068600 [Ceratopteris richardii]
MAALSLLATAVLRLPPQEQRPPIICSNRCYLKLSRARPLQFSLRCNGIFTGTLRQLLSGHHRGAPKLSMALVSPESANTLFCLMASCAALGQTVETKTAFGARLSAPLIALLFGMALAGAGIVPCTSACYDFVSSSIMPIAVALCLLETDMQTIFADAGCNIASSLCASYIGGTINYVATAQALGLTSSNMLTAGMAADNLAMAAYFSLIMSIPDSQDKATSGKEDNDSDNTSAVPNVLSFSASLAAAATACTLGNAIAQLLPTTFKGCGLAITALIASCFSVAAAHLPKSIPNVENEAFAGSQAVGSGLMLLYFSVVGASAGLRESFLGGWALLAFIIVLLSIHLGIILFLGWWSEFPMRVILIASNANIGGPGTAAAMASCRGWKNLVRPALLAGSLGYTIGTGIGCLVGLHVLRYLL